MHSLDRSLCSATRNHVPWEWCIMGGVLSCQSWSIHLFLGWPWRCFLEGVRMMTRWKINMTVKDLVCKHILLQVNDMAKRWNDAWREELGQLWYCYTPKDFGMKLCQLFLMMTHKHLMWEASSTFRSSESNVHASTAWRRMDRMSALYMWILSLMDSRISFQIQGQCVALCPSYSVPLMIGCFHSKGSFQLIRQCPGQHVRMQVYSWIQDFVNKSFTNKFSGQKWQ